MSKSPPLIFSVVIPTYNRKDYVRLAIESILENKNDTLFQLNIILVDDGSTDDTASALIPYVTSHKIHYFKIKNSERGFARNYGARFAIDHLKTDYLLFFDADDILRSGSLVTFHQHIIQNPNIKCFFAQYQILDIHQRLTRISPKIIWPVDVKKYVVENRPLLPLGCTIIHYSLFEITHGFIENRNLSGSEDWIFLFRIILIAPVKFIPVVTTNYRQHTENTNSSRFDKSLHMALKILKEKQAMWKITDSELEHLNIQFRYNQIGVHNCDPSGRPLHHLLQLIRGYPQQILRPNLYIYLVSICRKFFMDKMTGR